MGYVRHKRQIQGLFDSLYEITNEIVMQCVNEKCSNTAELKRELVVIQQESEALSRIVQRYRKHLS